MADISQSSCSSHSCNHCHTQTQQVRTNDVRLLRYGSSKITICSLRKEVISKNNGYGLQFRSYKMRFLEFLFAFSSFDVLGYHLT